MIWEGGWERREEEGGNEKEERKRKSRGRYRGEREEELADYTKSILTIWIPHLHHSQERIRIVFKKLLKCSCPHSGSTKGITYSTVAGSFLEDVRRLTVGHSCLVWP